MPEPTDHQETAAVDWGHEIRQYLPGAVRLAVRLSGDASVAEDLVQDALLKIARARESFRGDCQVQTWMTRILINVARDWKRSDSRQPTTESLQDNELPGHLNVSAVAPKAIEQQETTTKIWQAISELPDRQREVVTLAVWQEMPSQQIAETLEISLQNVYSNLSAAKQQLRNRLKIELLE